MKTVKIKISKLKLDDNNARKHSKRNLDSIKLSLQKFGQQKPIVVNESGVIIAGNGTFIAAKELGWQTIEVVTTALQEDEQGAFAIADNRIAELASWDYPILAEQLGTLLENDFDTSILGWAEHEISPLLEAEWKMPELTSIVGDDVNENHKTITFNEAQWETVKDCIRVYQQQQNQTDLTDSECMEKICIEWNEGRPRLVG